MKIFVMFIVDIVIGVNMFGICIFVFKICNEGDVRG